MLEGVVNCVGLPVAYYLPFSQLTVDCTPISSMV